MKKLLIMPMMAATLLTGLNAGDLDVTATVQPAATVHLGSAAGALVSGTSTFEDSAITFENNLNLGVENTQSIEVFANSNTQGDVTMTITPDTISTTQDGLTETMAVSFYYTADGSEVKDTDDTYTLTTDKNDGTNSVGKLTAKVTPTATQLAGEYTNTGIVVAIAAAL